MERDIICNLFLVVVTGFMVWGLVDIMNRIERRFKLIINKWIEKKKSRKRVEYNLWLINWRMKRNQ